MDARVVLVRTVDEYIKAIGGSWHKFSYFRGESRDYEQLRLTASALRRADYSMEKACAALHRRVFARLSPAEARHFPAFCQRHGLPTNLLPVAESALEALYFACEAGAEGENGYVYCFVDDFMDITALAGEMGAKNPLDLYRFRDTSAEQIVQWEAFFVAYSLRNYGVYEKLCKDITQWIKEHRTQPVLLGCLALMDWLPELRTDYEKQARQLLTESKNSPLRMPKDYIEYELETYSAEDIVFHLQWRWPKVLARLFLALLNQASAHAGEIVALLPRAVYRPLLRDDKEAYVYQWQYGEARGVLEPDYVIEVPAERKPGMLKALDGLGVNRGTIFGGFGDWAAHVVWEMVGE
ncbi:MAG: FRG domain-containing protein [Oscillospiraceae bacterium]|jgi:hypothetical protein|nr:FRG domain-containing protein [Oscillospiraceae bacterium]